MRLTFCQLADCMALLASPLAQAHENCEINGESVNPDNDNTTAGKTGTMRCKDAGSGALTREQGISNGNGKFTGLVQRCADRAVLAPAADDAAWCGFAAKASQVELFGSRSTLNARSSYLAGKRVRHETFNNDGKTSYLDEVSASARTERYFSNSGVKKREIQWALDGKSARR